MDREEEDIFSDDFKKEEKRTLVTSIKTENENSILKEQEKSSGLSRKKLGIIGLIIIILISAMAVGLWLSATGQLNNISTLLDCEYGVTTGFFEKRCVTKEEFESTQQEVTKPEQVNNPTGEEVPFKGVASATDKVDVQKTKEVLGYYLVTSDDDWYGDFVDFREIPNKIEKSGAQQINFRCYTDDFQGTSTYFATFRNVLKPNLSVDVFINGEKVQTQSTDTNRALILEGNCYGN